jgi:hypothetical protein
MSTITSPRRLTHTTNAAFRRYMQVSKAKVFVFVEGKTDQYFYSKICELVLRSQEINFQICQAQELPQTTGGKKSLLKFFSYLRRGNSLKDNFKGKTKVSIFYLDKDIDDLLGKSKTSDHIVYTQTYSVENYFFRYGELVEAVAAAASLTLAAVRSTFNTENKAWQRTAAENWKDWVKLCVYSGKHRIHYECNYSVPSRVNHGPYTPVNAIWYTDRLGELERRSTLTARGFKLSFGYVSRQIDKLYDEGDFDSVFKGKWYVTFLAFDASRLSGGATVAAGKLLTALQITLDVREEWSDHFTVPLRRLIGELDDVL